MNRYFADISNNNGTFNAKEYAHSGHILIAIKATEGVGPVQNVYVERVNEAHSSKLVVAHYHFARPDNHANGKSEAISFAKGIAGHVRKNDILVLDLETRGKVNMQTYMRQFETELHRHYPHYPMVLYTYSSFLSEYSLKPASNRLWIANYSGKIMPLLIGVKNWAHQFTDGKLGAKPHTCKGIGQCDVSRLNMRSYLRLRRVRGK